MSKEEKTARISAPSYKSVATVLRIEILAADKKFNWTSGYKNHFFRYKQIQKTARGILPSRRPLLINLGYRALILINPLIYIYIYIRKNGFVCIYVHMYT